MRTSLGMTQEELALKCGYKSRSSINKIELVRDLPLKKLLLVARALNVSPNYLLGYEDDNSIGNTIMNNSKNGGNNMLILVKNKKEIIKSAETREELQDKIREIFSAATSKKEEDEEVWLYHNSVSSWKLSLGNRKDRSIKKVDVYEIWDAIPID